MSEFESEPVRGLPERLPDGERLLWQGAPSWIALAQSAFHIRGVALYCGAIVAWRFGADVAQKKGFAASAIDAVWLLPFAGAAVGLLALAALLYARTTVYTITNQRVVMRYGVALPMTLNLPFKQIGAAGLKTYAHGAGDIPLSLLGEGRIAYTHLWPFARPWRLSHSEPMLRAVPNSAEVANVLARALAAAAPGQTFRAAAEAGASSDPEGHRLGAATA